MAEPAFWHQTGSESSKDWGVTACSLRACTKNFDQIGPTDTGLDGTRPEILDGQQLTRKEGQWPSTSASAPS
jgi:hypothetical protein